MCTCMLYIFALRIRLSYLPILHSGVYYDSDIDSAVRDIQTMLASKVAHRWYQMGVILGVPVAQLENIRLKNADAGDCERVMFTKFLSADREALRPTWQLLVDAVGHKAGGNNVGLAQTLSNKVAERFPGMLMCHQVRNW